MIGQFNFGDSNIVTHWVPGAFDVIMAWKTNNLTQSMTAIADIANGKMVIVVD